MFTTGHAELENRLLGKFDAASQKRELSTMAECAKILSQVFSFVFVWMIVSVTMIIPHIYLFRMFMVIALQLSSQNVAFTELISYANIYW